MKILILGGNGMIGNSLFLELSKLFDVKVSMRYGWDRYKTFKIYRKKDCFLNIDASNIDTIENIIESFKPQVVINTIGIIKQKIDTQNIENCIFLNSIFPHKLSKLIKKLIFRLILLSSDCVFSGEGRVY